ncbi:M48 family metallopeptidase [Embleya sp. AB8]|uniref:M48 family metallopeptidase n=1 Tax=Embleya sp. AB8 TaxID=3156304 RepID=UPI003C783CEB
MDLRMDGAEQFEECPQCGARVPVESRFVTWCARCDWNVDPGGAPEPAPGRIDALRRRLVHRYGEQLLIEVGSGATGRPPRSSYRALAYGLALLVHGVTVALLVGGVLLLVLGWGTFLGPVLGVLLLAMACVLRPRLLSRPRGVPTLERADAPTLFAVIDEIAAAVGTSGVHVVVFDAEFNASVTRYGLRQRRMLRLGLGVWQVATPQQRVALLGHELGHYAHGDDRHGIIVGNALHSLRVWYYLLAPTPRPGLGARLVDLLAFGPRWAVYGVLVLLDHVTIGAAQHAEYLADRSAARVGSSVAAVELMDRLLIGSSVAGELRRQVVAANTRVGRAAPRDRVGAELWTNLATHAEAIPEREYERLRRVSVLRGHGVDSRHPPTHLRRRVLGDDEQYPGSVRLDAERNAAVEAELAPTCVRLAEEVIRGHVG